MQGRPPRLLPERRYLLYALIFGVLMVLGVAGAAGAYFWTDYRANQLTGRPGWSANEEELAELEQLYLVSTYVEFGCGALACGALLGAAGCGLLFFFTRKSNRVLRME